MRGVHFIDFDAVDLGKLLDAALYLHAFGCLVAEPLYEILCFLDHLLLVLECAHLLFQSFLSQHYVFGIIDRVVINLSKGDLDGAIGHIVDECSVVAHKNYGIGFGGKEIFEPLYRLYVKVVGGLVEQKHVRACQEQFGKLNAHAPTSGEF